MKIYVLARDEHSGNSADYLVIKEVREIAGFIYFGTTFAAHDKEYKHLGNFETLHEAVKAIEEAS